MFLFKKALALVCFFFYIISFSLWAEPFRVRRMHVVEFDNLKSDYKIECCANDGIAVFPGHDVFLQGIELNIKVPKIVAEWIDSVVWSIYSDVNGIPVPKKIDYNGERTDSGSFGTSLSYNIKIPVTENSTIKKDAYSYVAEGNLMKKQDFVFLRLHQAMKGVPNELTNSKFEITVKPVLKDLGLLKIHAESPDGSELKQFSVFIDEKKADLSENIYLKSGSHNISFVSDFYRNELRAVSIEKAEITDLKVKFKDIKPFVRIIAPTGTVITFDEDSVSGENSGFYTAAGDHAVKLVIGDYEILKTISVIDGRSYNISVNFDAVVSEED